MSEREWQRVRSAVLDTDRLVRAVVSGRQRNAVVDFRRIELRNVEVRSRLMLQVTSYDETQAHIRNVELGPAAEQVVEGLLSSGYASWHVDLVDETLQLRVTKKGRVLAHSAARQPDEQVMPDRGHDRAKRRLLDAEDPLFRRLGVTTEDGRVKPTRNAKFRQVQDFLAAIDPLIADAVSLGPGAALSSEQPLRIVDLGCGNAYLTFAAHRYLSATRAIPTRIVGVDVKAQALEHNSRIAKELGVDAEVTFIRGGIADASVPDPPDMVLALHACDTATDDALARAVAWDAPVVVAAPCCHHDIARQLGAASSPTAYRLVTRHGILRERMADVLTDALRAALLRLIGYRVEVIEFVDSQHTPRNAMIRAVRTGAAPDADAVAGYRELVAQWQITPALEPKLRTMRPALDALLA